MSTDKAMVTDDARLVSLPLAMMRLAAFELREKGGGVANMVAKAIEIEMRHTLAQAEQPVETFNPAHTSKATADQMAAVMFFHGTPEQQRQALARPPSKREAGESTPAPATHLSGWTKVPDEPPHQLLKSINVNNQVLAYENGRYYNAWFEFEPSEGGWFWTDDADSEPNPTHYRLLSEVALASEGQE